jgi:hypothetical protein
LRRSRPGGYYDSRVEHAKETAARFRSLFTYDPKAGKD